MTDEIGDIDPELADDDLAPDGDPPLEDGSTFEESEDFDDEAEDGGDFADDDEDDEAEEVATVDVGDGDDDDEPAVEPAVDIGLLEGLTIEVDDDEDEDDEDDVINDGEFVCRSCHMAKRASALADADGMLCRDCV